MMFLNETGKKHLLARALIGGLFFLLLFNVASTRPLLAQETITLTNIHSVSLGSDWLILEDKDSRLKIDDILQSKQQDFVPASTANLAGQYSESTFWLKVNIDNQTDRETWYVHPQTYIWSTFEGFVTTGNSPAPIQQQRLKKRYTVIELNLPKHQQSTLYLRMRTEDIAAFNMNLGPNTYVRDEIEDAFIYILVGIICSLIVYNGFLFLSLKDRSYFFYLLYAVTNGLFAFFSVNVPMSFFNWEYNALVRPLGPITTILFTQSFFQMRESYPRLNRVANALNLILLVMLASGFWLHQTTLLGIEDIVFLGVICFLLGIGIYSFRRGYRPARFYLGGIGIFMLSIFCMILTAAGIFPANNFANTVLLQGQAYEMFLMSLALASRIKLLQEEKMTAEVISQYKSRLLRVISHDISNPLTVVTFLARKIMEESKPQEVAISKILRAVEMIQDIHNFVLKTEHVNQSGAMRLESVDIGAVFEQLQLLFENKAQEKNIQLTFQVAGKGLKAQSDKVALTNEILSNLISNAIKFSFAGGVVAVTAVEDNDHILISVRDEGTGIETDRLKGIFEPSKASSTRGTAGESGTGFGLPLVETYVRAFGGKLVVESTLKDDATPHAKHGTQFKIWLRKG